MEQHIKDEGDIDFVRVSRADRWNFRFSKRPVLCSLRRAPSFVICLWRNDLLRYRVFTRFLFQLNVGVSAWERETETQINAS